MAQDNGKKAGVFFGYVVVVALIITSFMPLSFGLSCAGIFYPSISEDLGVGSGFLSYYTPLLWVSALVTLPVMGRLLNNADARLCLTAAVVIAAADFVWLSFTSTLWQFYLGGFVMGISVGMLLFLAPSTLINRWFAKRAGFLLGIVMAFTGVGGMVWSTVGGMLINAVGWSSTYLVFAALSACTIPVTLFMVSSSPADKGLAPWGAEQAAMACEVDGQSVPASGVTASEAFKSPVFYLILGLCFLLNIGMYVYFMIPSYAETLAISATMPLLGATASSVAMAGQTIAKLILGATGEKHPSVSTVAMLALGMVGLGLFGFLYGSVVLFYVAALFFGMYYGITNVMMPIFTRMSFGDRDYARIYSRVSMVASISNAVAGFILGAVIDLTGGYGVMFALVAVMMLVAILLTVLVVRSRHTVQVSSGVERE